jgi:hypothetical protein
MNAPAKLLTDAELEAHFRAMNEGREPPAPVSAEQAQQLLRYFQAKGAITFVTMNEGTKQ